MQQGKGLRTGSLLMLCGRCQGLELLDRGGVDSCVVQVIPVSCQMFIWSLCCSYWTQFLRRLGPLSEIFIQLLDGNPLWASCFYTWAFYLDQIQRSQQCGKGQAEIYVSLPNLYPFKIKLCMSVTYVGCCICGHYLQHNDAFSNISIQGNYFMHSLPL